MDELVVADPWDITTDLGPVITPAAAADITAHIEQARAQGRLLHQLPLRTARGYVAPALIRVSGIEAVGREVFGPVLHVATFKAKDLDAVIAAVNGTRLTPLACTRASTIGRKRSQTLFARVIFTPTAIKSARLLAASPSG